VTAEFERLYRANVDVVTAYFALRTADPQVVPTSPRTPARPARHVHQQQRLKVANSAGSRGGGVPPPRSIVAF
jgi:hypothetical protein